MFMLPIHIFYMHAFISHILITAIFLQISGARKIVGQGLADIVRVLQVSGLRLLKMIDQAECQILKNTESRELEGLYISVPQPAQVVPDQLQDQLQVIIIHDLASFSENFPLLLNMYLPDITDYTVS